MIRILFEDNHLLVVEKPVNLPVNADSSADPDLLELLKADLKKRYQKTGNVYLGLVHRLDRPVGGVMVFAKTSKAASRLSRQIRDQEMEKTYLAVVEGQCAEQGTFTDKLLKDQDRNIVKIDSKGKEAVLTYKTLAFKDDLSLVRVKLITGRSHQIRVQFSAHGHPLWGDQKYNTHAKPGQQIALYAAELTFKHPVSGEVLTFNLQPTQSPFADFK